MRLKGSRTLAACRDGGAGRIVNGKLKACSTAVNTLTPLCGVITFGHKLAAPARAIMKRTYCDVPLRPCAQLPVVGGRALDVSALYREVVKMGGHGTVTSLKVQKVAAPHMRLCIR